MTVDLLPKRRVGQIATGTLIGPTSYTSPFTLDLGATFASLDAWDYIILVQGGMGVHRLEHTISGVVVSVKVIQEKYDSVSTIDNINAGSQPSGVSIAITQNQTVANESAHVHALDHNHGFFTSAGPTGGVAGANTVGGTAAMTTHAHQLDIPAITGNTGAGNAHNHIDNLLYAHDHSFTTAATNTSVAEIANGTNVSGSQWRWMAIGTLL